MKTLLTAVVAATLALCAIGAGADAMPGERKVALTIESTSLAAALDKWAQQSGYQIFVEQEIIKNLIAPDLNGTYTAQEALEKLLEGTTLTYVWLNEKAVSIRRKPRPTVPTALQRTRLEEQASTPIAKFSSDGVPGTSGSSAAAQFDPGESGARPPGDNVESLEEIVVTGTHIRGAAPVGSQLIVIDREQLKTSGYGRAQDFLDTLPQNFSGNAGEDWSNDFGAGNLTRGQAVDLRGLGASSTLVLIDGRRQPAGGTQGSFVDISSIPTAAIDRIEVLPDGASAIYGSDAIGGVVNFVLRKDYQGIEADVRVATLGGASDEVRPSIVFGEQWDGGNVLLGYQFYHRDALMAKDTFYGKRGRDYRSLGGSDFRFPVTNPGTIFDGNFVPAYAIPAGQDGRSLTVADLIPGANPEDALTGRASLPEQQMHSAFFTLSQSLSDRFQIFADGRYSQRDMTLEFEGAKGFLFVPDSNPFFVDPFGTGLVLVGYDFRKDFGDPAVQISDTETYGMAAGVIGELGGGWQANFTASYGGERNDWEQRNVADADRLAIALADSNPATAFNPFGDGSNTNPQTIAFIRSVQLQQSKSRVRSLSLTADGPIFTLPAGDVKVAIGADRRDERLDADGGSLAPSTGVLTRSPSSVGNLEREVDSLFAELNVPLFGHTSSASSARADLSLAGRYEDYSDFGSTFNPKIGFSVTPLRGVQFRGTWGTSFRAPRFNEVSPTANPSVAFGAIGIPDPRSPTGITNALVLAGGNPDLKEETADVWSAGFALAPPAWSGVSFSASYFSIDYQDRIATGGAFNDTLLFEDQWREIITRDPTSAQVAAICNRSDFDGLCPPAPAAILDERLRNLAQVEVSGIDFDLHGPAQLPLGVLELGIAGTYMLKYASAVSSTSEPTELVDTVGNPLALRLRGHASWSVGDFSLHALLNHTGSSRDAFTHKNIGSWTTADLSAVYRFTSGGLWSGTTLLLSAVNVLNKEPPFLDSFNGFDPTNATEMGRLLSVEITKNW